MELQDSPLGRSPVSPLVVVDGMSREDEEHVGSEQKV